MENGISNEGRMKLTEEGRDAIRQEVSNLLRAWGTVLGVTNLIALAGVLWFVFTQLPVNAAQLAETQIRSQVESVTEPVISSALRAFEAVNLAQVNAERLTQEIGEKTINVQTETDLVIEKVDKLDESIAKVQQAATEAQSKTEAIESALNALEQTDEVELGKIVEQLSQNPEVIDLAITLSEINQQLVSIESELTSLKGRVTSAEEVVKLVPSLSTDLSDLNNDLARLNTEFDTSQIKLYTESRMFGSGDAGGNPLLSQFTDVTITAPQGAKILAAWPIPQDNLGDLSEFSLGEEKPTLSGNRAVFRMKGSGEPGLLRVLFVVLYQ